MLSLHSGRVSTGDFGLALRILRNAEIAQWRRLPSGGNYRVVEHVRFDTAGMNAGYGLVRSALFLVRQGE